MPLTLDSSSSCTAVAGGEKQVQWRNSASLTHVCCTALHSQLTGTHNPTPYRTSRARTEVHGDYDVGARCEIVYVCDVNMY